MDKTIVSDFYCIQCGAKGIPIPRKKGNQREPGHLKKLFCLNCKKETNHIEVRQIGEYTLEYFLAEKRFNNFDEDGNRIMPYRQFIGNLKQKGEF